jgi:hypothetical protein
MNGNPNGGLDIGGDVGLVLTLTDALRAVGTTRV